MSPTQRRKDQGKTDQPDPSEWRAENQDKCGADCHDVLLKIGGAASPRLCHRHWINSRTHPRPYCLSGGEFENGTG